MMAERLPGFLQPFLTWVTAKPAPGETYRELRPIHHVGAALAWIAGGLLVGALGWQLGYDALALVPIALVLVSCGLGLFQVVIFHHCSHGTVFQTRERNRLVGRIVSAVLLFKHFDLYQREHMLHHSPRKLLTEEDEFAQFVFGLCGLEAGVPKQELWRRVLVKLASPQFHLRFLQRRIQASLWSHDPLHNWLGRLFWLALLGAAAATGRLAEAAVLWVLPVTVLLQIATVFRILCEHRFPDARLIAGRDKMFVTAATGGVFPGAMPPAMGDPLAARLAGWAAWWAEMLTWQLFVRLFVLVGDAPAHDYHHRRPASKRWANYIHARQKDADEGSPGFPAGYNENWGLIAAIDFNLATLAATEPATIGRRSTSSLEDTLGRQLDGNGGAVVQLAA
jgi:fatty acid desaturase